MFEKPKRSKKASIQDRLQPTTIEGLVQKYDLDNTDIYDFLDEFVYYINNKNILNLEYETVEEW